MVELSATNYTAASRLRLKMTSTDIGMTSNLVPRAFLVVARELRKTLVKYDEISKILGDLSHAQ